jgi:hypothetical protein
MEAAGVREASRICNHSTASAAASWGLTPDVSALYVGVQRLTRASPHAISPPYGHEPAPFGGIVQSTKCDLLTDQSGDRCVICKLGQLSAGRATMTFDDDSGLTW